MSIKKCSLYLFVLSIVVVLILWIVVSFFSVLFESAPILLDINNPKAIFTISKKDEYCQVTGKDNGFGVNTVMTASENVDLKKYVGEKVKLRGKFIYSGLEAIVGCKLNKTKSLSSNVVLEITKVILVK